jgi:glycosyltransferase involved in cell wall biosynthesis
VDTPLKPPTRLKVLINALHAKTGGGVTHLRAVLPYLAKDPRLEIHLVLHQSQLSRFDPLDEGIHLHSVSFRESYFHTLWWEQVRLPLMARRLGARVTFSPANFGPMFAPRPVIMLRNALAVGRRDWRPRRWVYWSVLTLMTMASLLRARRAIAVSDYARRALSFGLARQRIAVIPHGVDPAYSPPPAGSARGDFLLAVGDIYVQKNYLMLIDALAIARQTHPGLTLKIAGANVGDEYPGQVTDAIKRHGLGDAIELLGSVDRNRLIALYRDCALLVFPSTAETFGHPLVEAMASGAPIASSNQAAMPEILGDAGIYFNPLDPRDMAAAIGKIIDDRDLAARLSIAARERAKRYSWEKAARDTADILVTAGS